ncbi:MAG TPA: SpoIIE family protein phosphatase [Kofleriaceae bacterium]|jgi:sigma-B regulation protein RsbU (phosphoserine phosphatase)
MKLRTTVFLWVIVLVLAVLGAAIGTIAVVFDNSTRARLADEQMRSRDVTLELHADRQSLHTQECHVVAQEPRVKAVVATEDIAQETIQDAARDMATTLKAGVFVIVDSDGNVLADSVDPKAAGAKLGGNEIVTKALTDGDAAGVWIADGKPFQVHGCRLEFGARIVGALVIGHAIDDSFAQQVGKHTGAQLVVAVNNKAVTTLPKGLGDADVAAALDAARAGKKEVQFGEALWFAQIVPVPDYKGTEHAEYLLLRSIDEALAPGRRIIHILLAIVVGGALLSLLFALGLARGLSRPIDALVERTRAIARGDLSAKPIKGPTEVASLGAAMDRMANEIEESRAQLADKERLAQEMAIAARIQNGILPKRLEVPGLSIAAKMITATEVGGDYYDVLSTEDGAWLAIGDVSGHGVTAGLVMMMVQTGFGALVRSNPTGSPKDMVRTLNAVLYDNIHDRLETERHMTLSLLRYHQNGEIVVAGAHMDGIVWRAATKKCELLGTPGTFLAITEDIDHVNLETSWKLEDGDILVLLTDGVTEAENTKGEAFEYIGVTQIVESNPQASSASIRDAVFAGLNKHTKVLVDDATIMVLRYATPAAKDPA